MEFVVHETNTQTNLNCSDDQTEPLSLHKTTHSIIHAVDLFEKEIQHVCRFERSCKTS